MRMKLGPHAQQAGTGGVAAALSGIVRSRRVYLGVITNALSSLGNFAVSLALVRVLGLSELGEFAIAFAVYAFCTGLVRAAVCEPLLAMSPGSTALISGANRASLAGLASTVLLIVIGIALSTPYLAVLGLAVHGLVIFDYSKTMNLAMFNRRVPLLQETAWFLASIVAGGLMLGGWIGGVQGFAVWAGAGAVIGYVSGLFQSLDMRPRWNLPATETGNAVAFGGDYVVGSGSSQVAFNLVGVAAGLQAVGTLRAGATLLGPVSIVIGSARTLAIPYLTRGIAQGGRAVWSRSLASTAIIAVVSLPLLAFIAFLPPVLGGLLLGENWVHAEPVLPFLALEMAFITLTTVPFAGFRALLAGRVTVTVRSFLAIVRVTVVVLAAATGGVLFAAVALAAASALGTLVWWVGYLVQIRRAVRMGG